MSFLDSSEFSRPDEQTVRTASGKRWSSADPSTGSPTRELDVLHLLAQGLSNAELAARFFVERTTTEYHLAGLLKIEAHNDAVLSCSGRVAVRTS